MRTNNGISGKEADTELTWNITIKRRAGTPEQAQIRGWVFPAAPHERTKVDDSARSVIVKASANGNSWAEIVAGPIPEDRRLLLKRPLRPAHLRFTFTSRSGRLLILPDVEFIK